VSQRIKVGSRPSKLALAQVDEIQAKLKGISFKIVLIETKGDKDKKTSLSLRENTDFFTFEIEQALLDKRIDIAIHSAKDLEKNPPSELEVIALTKSLSIFDCLASKFDFTLDTLPKASRVGTSSQSRKDSLLKYRSDLIVKDIRGNIDERLSQLDKGNFEAIIVAQVALMRLGYENRISQVISPNIITPHVLQGRLAVQIRQDRSDLREIFKEIDDK
jgi:hydroxymethylbilane synthase